LGELALVLTTLIWGTTFILVKDSLVEIAPVRFLVLRFACSAVVLLLVAFFARARIDRATWRGGLIASVPFAAVFLFQTFGLLWASPATSAFITSVSVVLVPVFSVLFLHRRFGAWTWIGVFAAFVGLGALSVRGDWSMGPGELLTMGTAVGGAIHVLVLERFSPGKSAVALTAVMLLGGTVLCALFLPLDHALLGRPEGLFDPLPTRLWAVILFMAVIGTAVTFFLQTWAQARMSATRVGVLIALEPVFALLFSVAMGREAITARAVAGMILILAGMLAVETLGRRAESSTVPA
jgi:drug/metabolite transporter (DMT)-like permease